MDCDFMCNENQLNTLIDNYKIAEKNITSAMADAETLLSKLQTSECWKGNNKDAMVAFMDIIVQYHKELCAQGDGAILGKAEDTLIQLHDNSVGFCAASPAYREMEAL